MAVQITLRGVNFNNAALPVVGNMIRTGLRGAWRFGGGYESAADLSGNESQLTEKGQVSFTPQGVVGDLDNGFVTDLDQTLSRTYIGVFRVPASVDVTFHSGMVVGNYTDNDESAGGCLWIDGDAGAGLRGIRNQQHFFVEENTGTNQNGSTSIGPEMEADADHIWLFFAGVIDAENSKNFCYSPTLKDYALADTYNEIQNSQYDFTAQTPSPNKLEIISTPDSNWSRGLSSVLEVSEILIYDRALTLDEVKKQYEYSKEYHAKIKGITI